MISGRFEPKKTGLDTLFCFRFRAEVSTVRERRKQCFVRYKTRQEAVNHPFLMDTMPQRCSAGTTPEKADTLTLIGCGFCRAGVQRVQPFVLG